MSSQKRRIYIFDTTLRDGEQSPGASLDSEGKIRIAHQLSRLGVDIIEAGFPISSQAAFEAVRRISREVRKPVIAALARALKPDIHRAAEALRNAARPRIHVFLATSKIHMKYKLKMAEEEILRQAKAMVKYARRFTDDVEFSPEDASRTNPDFLCTVVEEVIRAGAGTVNIADTVGYAMPEVFGNLIRTLHEKIPNINRAKISVHCHNDLGLATANSLFAVKSGAEQVECAVNGLGERAGNASLEEVVMAIKTRHDFFRCYTGINTKEIYKTSRLVSSLTGLIVQPNKAIVGKNAFSHEAGIHQDGVLKERRTYEIMTPQSVGLSSNQLVLGRHSGRHAFKARLASLGYHLSEKELEKAFVAFKQLADRKKEVFDDDLESLVGTQISMAPGKYRLESMNVVSGTETVPTATIRLVFAGKIKQEAACGDGPVAAVYNAIDRITGIKVKLLEYSLNAITGGKDAQGEVTVVVETRGRQFIGRGVSTDIIEASARAYLNAINKAARK